MQTCRTRRSTSPTETSPLYQRAQELAGGNLSAAIASALRRYVDVEEGLREGFDEIIVRVGPRPGRKVRFTGVLLGEWVNTTPSRVETFRVYRGRTGKFVLHVERTPDFTIVDEQGQAGRLAGQPRPRLERQLRQCRPASPPSMSSSRSTSSASGSRRSSTSMVAGSAKQPPDRGPGHLAPPLRSMRGASRGAGHDRARTAGPRSARPGCASRTASRSSSTAST